MERMRIHCGNVTFTGGPEDVSGPLLQTASSNFDYGGPLTEILLLGIAATRADAKLQWERSSPIGDQANPSRSDGLVTARPGRFMTCV